MQKWLRAEQDLIVYYMPSWNQISEIKLEAILTKVFVFSSSKKEIIEGSASKSSDSVRNYNQILKIPYSTKIVYSIFKRV